MSTEGKWATIRVPSRPSHQKLWCGKRFVSFHDNFWVSSPRIPASTANCGNAAE